MDIAKSTTDGRSATTLGTLCCRCATCGAASLCRTVAAQHVQKTIRKRVVRHHPGRRLAHLVPAPRFHHRAGPDHRALGVAARPARSSRRSCSTRWSRSTSARASPRRCWSKLAKDSPLGAVLAAGLRNHKSSRYVMKEAIEEAGRAVAHDLERFLTTLGTIATAAPLLGLFGTVIGMIEIFGSQAPTGANPQQLAHGISIALYNTAFGIGIAVPVADLLPPLPPQGRQPDRRDGAAGDQAGRHPARRARRLSGAAAAGLAR